MSRLKRFKFIGYHTLIELLFFYPNFRSTMS